MYISEFFAGVISTFLLEFVAIVVFVIVYAIKSRRKKRYGENMEHKKD